MLTNSYRVFCKNVLGKNLLKIVQSEVARSEKLENKSIHLISHPKILKTGILHNIILCSNISAEIVNINIDKELQGVKRQSLEQIEFVFVKASYYLKIFKDK